MIGTCENVIMGDLRLFQSIGLSEAKAKETAKNSVLSKNLTWIITEVSYIVGFTEYDQIARVYHVLLNVCTNLVHDRPPHYALDRSVNKLESYCTT